MNKNWEPHLNKLSASRGARQSDNWILQEHEEAVSAEMEGVSQKGPTKRKRGKETEELKSLWKRKQFFPRYEKEVWHLGKGR